MNGAPDSENGMTKVTEVSLHSADPRKLLGLQERCGVWSGEGAGQRSAPLQGPAPHSHSGMI